MSSEDLEIRIKKVADQFLDIRGDFKHASEVSIEACVDEIKVLLNAHICILKQEDMEGESSCKKPYCYHDNNEEAQLDICDVANY